MTSRICLAVLACTLLLGLLIPVYTDEVAWRFAARAALDGVDRPVFVNCGANTLAVPPLFILALRNISAATNLTLADPIYVRLAGVAWAIVWLSAVLLLIRTISRSHQERATLTLLAVSLLSLGTLPLVLVMSRPEQPVLLALTTAILIALSGQVSGDPPSVRKSLAAAWGIALLGAVALAYHLKGVAYLPVFIACALLSSRGDAGRFARWSSAAGLVVMGAIAARYWIDRFKCPNDAVLARLLAEHSIAAGSLDASGLAGRIAAASNPLSYVGLIVPRGRSGSDWLPPVSVTPLDWILAIGIPFAWFAGIALAAACLVRAATSQRHGALPMRLLVLGVTIVVVLAVWGFTQVHRNFYEAGLFLPMLLIAIILLVRGANLPENALSKVGRAAAVAAALGAFSQLVVISKYMPSLLGSARQAGYIDAQRHSISPFGYAALEQQIIATGKLCGIDPQQRLRSLLIDDLTYFAYMRSYRPLHHLGIVSIWNGEIRDPLAYLKQQGSSGAVLGCKYLSPEMRAGAKQSGEFCCLGASDLTDLSAAQAQVLNRLLLTER
ncbi:MAG TPA: hypothetical protein VM913_03635 [Sphingomicrobium sp.]|nr:hypothetical protein [Sphingomicrobium sp.]